MTRVLVCGGRDFADDRLLWRVMLKVLTDKMDRVTVIHGGARGADELAGKWAATLGLDAEVYPADWQQHGRAAGPIRNQRMLDEGRPDLVVAFPGGSGTADMVRRAKAAGVEVIEIEEDAA